MTTSIFSCGSMRKNHFFGPGSLLIGCALVLLILYTATGLAQELTAADQAEADFQEAVEQYRQADYYRALMGFRGLLRDHPQHRRVTASLLMQAKCYYWLQNYDQAMGSLESLLSDYPRTSYRQNAAYLLGICHYRLEHYWRSADQLRQVITEGDDPRLIDLSRDGLRVVISEQLSLRQLDNLYLDLSDDPVSPWILLEMARRELSQGHRDEALARAEELLRRFPDSPAAEQARVLHGRAAEEPPHRLTIGVICPLSGSYADYGKDLQQGVELAVEQHRSFSGIDIDVQVRDSGGSAVRAVRAAGELIEEQNVTALVGPLLSANAVGVGAVCAVSYTHLRAHET